MNHYEPLWTTTNHYKPLQNITNHHKTSRIIMNHHKKSRNIWNYQETSWIITNHHETSRITTNLHQSSWNIANYHETSWIIMNHHKTSWTIINHPMFWLKLHVSVNISVNSRRICTKPSRSRVNFSRRSEWGVTSPCFDLNCTFRSISQWILDGFARNLHEVGLTFRDDRNEG